MLCHFSLETKWIFFSMTSQSMLCFPNVFRISVANRKVGKTNSMLILKNNIHEITQNFWNLPRFRSLPVLPILSCIVNVVLKSIQLTELYFFKQLWSKGSFYTWNNFKNNKKKHYRKKICRHNIIRKKI